VIDRLKQAKEFSYDLETSSLDYLSSRILSISFSWKAETAATIPFFRQHLEPIWTEDENKAIYAKLKSIMEDSQYRKIAQNGKFDNQHLFSNKIKLQGFYGDTLLAHYCVNENESHGLKALAWVYTDVGGYDNKLEELRDIWSKKLGIPKKELSYADLPHEELWEYANCDADVTLRIWKILYAEMVAQGVDGFFYDYMMPMSEFLTYLEYRGVAIDKKYLDKIILKFRERISKLSSRITEDKDVQRYVLYRQEKHSQERLERWRKSKSIQKRFTKEAYCNVGIDKIQFNSKSPKQLKELFIDLLQKKVVKKTKSGNPAFDREALTIYSHKVPVAKLMSEKNKLGTLLSTFLEGMRNNIRVDGKLHSSFNLHVAKTGRLSSSNVNLQNIPNKTNNPTTAKLIRNIFTADSPDDVLLDADYGQAEFRVWAQFSGDQVLIDDLLAGVDIHRKIAALGFGVPEEDVTIEQRGVAKTIVFGNMYGRSPKSVAKQLGVSIQQAEKIQDVLFKRYKVAARWIESTKKLAARDKQVIGLFGQIRHLKELMESPIEDVRSKAIRQSVNSPIQGSASQMACFAAMRIQSMLDERGIRGRVLLLVHDSILVNIDKTRVEEGKAIMEEAMLHPHPNVNRVPLKIDVSTGWRWGDPIKSTEESLEGEEEAPDDYKGVLYNVYARSMEGPEEVVAWMSPMEELSDKDKKSEIIETRLTYVQAEKLVKKLQDNSVRQEEEQPKLVIKKPSTSKSKKEVTYDIWAHPESDCIWVELSTNKKKIYDTVVEKEPLVELWQQNLTYEKLVQAFDEIKTIEGNLELPELYTKAEFEKIMTQQTLPEVDKQKEVTYDIWVHDASGAIFLELSAARDRVKDKLDDGNLELWYNDVVKSEALEVIKEVENKTGFVYDRPSKEAILANEYYTEAEKASMIRELKINLGYEV
jgi:DNA polymerase-1